MSPPLALLWLTLLWLPALAQAQTLQLESCRAERTILQPWLQVHEDARGDYTLEDFLAAASAELRSMEQSRLRPGLDSAALWLRVEVLNSGTADCRMWLFPGAPRARDMRLFQQQDGQWQQRLAGADWPLHRWDSPVRLPAFELQLPAGQSRSFILRMGNSPPVAMQPMLLSHEGLARIRMAESTADGVAFGIVGLLVLLCLVVGTLYRWPLLFAHAMAVLLYVLFVALRTGYGFVYLWPDAPGLDSNLIILVRAAMGVAVIGYLRLLLQVRRFPRWCGHLVSSWQALLVLYGLGQIVLGGVLLDNTLSWAVSGVSAVLMLVMTWYGHRQRLRYNWFCYLFPSLVALQILIQGGSVLRLWQMSTYEYSWYSMSVLPNSVLLLYTLVSQVQLGRQREKRALLDIDQLKQTERERLEHTVAVRTSQLRDALSAQNHLLARISHDLRSPMQGILDSARQLRGTGQVQQHADHIEQHARLQLELIDELLEFSRSELQHMELLIAPGYLFGFLREIEDIGHFLAQRNHNHFSCLLADDLPLLVNADFRRLRQILVNLLSNAGKFTRNGSIEFRVSRGAQGDAGQALLEFSVQDNGIGIPSEELARLTEPFQRASNATRHEGTGLGLYIVRQMLERMDSQLHIARPTGGGSRFGFTLQLELAAEQELDTVMEESHLPCVSGAGKRILVVDDADLSRELLYELLSGYDYEVYACADAGQAVDWLTGESPDLVLCDQYMPLSSGWVLLDWIRRHRPELPVILHSASPPRPPAEYRHLEFDACVLKLAQTDRLLRLIGSTLKQTPALAQACDEPG
ncbi:hybrid sensor histidine kinase/response regulator [Halopseudomonas xiamenensis]|uniref:hybrid sensor histidine kinase/response regulator n=1 Tax=Halopseudomonas xiamenensis TaxID=157792 RepID=UPI00162A53ED|nr:ATP-binding protein [Halopseudomonas xiamenensis]